MACLIIFGVFMALQVAVLYQVNMLLQNGKILSDVAVLMSLNELPNQEGPIDEFVITDYRDYFECVEMTNAVKKNLDLNNLLFNNKNIVDAVREQFFASESGSKVMKGPFQTEDGIYFINFEMRWMGNKDMTHIIFCYYEGGYKAMLPSKTQYIEVDTGTFFKNIKKQLVTVPSKPHLLTQKQARDTMMHFEQQYRKRISTEIMNFIGFSLKIAYISTNASDQKKEPSLTLGDS